MIKIKEEARDADSLIGQAAGSSRQQVAFASALERKTSHKQLKQKASVFFVGRYHQWIVEAYSLEG